MVRLIDHPVFDRIFRRQHVQKATRLSLGLVSPESATERPA